MKKVFTIALRFIINIFIISIIFSCAAGIKKILFMEISNRSFSTFFNASVISFCFYMPAFCAVAFVSILAYAIRKENIRFIHFFLVAVILMIVLFAVQPFLYSIKYNLENGTDNILTETELNMDFFQMDEGLENIKHDIEKILKDLQDSYTESYLKYLLFASAFSFFLFSLWSLTVNVKWKILNVMLIIITFRVFLFFYAYICNEKYLYSLFSMKESIDFVLYLIIVLTGLVFFLAGFISSKLIKREM